MDVLRFDRRDRPAKEYRPIKPVHGGWAVGAPQGQSPLYGLPDLPAEGVIFVVEGEKAAECARRLGLQVTTSAFGASAASRTDWEPLAGREVVILPDADEAGASYANAVIQELHGLTPPAAVRVLELPGLAKGEDLVDFVEGRQGAGKRLPGIANEVLELAGAADVLQSGSDGVAPLHVAREETPDGLHVYQPFPVEVLPKPMLDLAVQGAKAMGCDPAYIAVPALAAAAGALGNAMVIEPKEGWQEPAVVWAVIVGESGTMKSPAMDLVVKPLLHRDRELIEKYRDQAVEFMAALTDFEVEEERWKKGGVDGDRPSRPPEPRSERLVTQDPTVQALAALLQESPFGMVLYNDELSAWFGSLDKFTGGSGGDMPHYLSMHRAGSLSVDRKGSIKNPIVVPRAALSIIGGIQPKVLDRALGREHRENGALARFLVVAPPPRPKAWTEEVCPAGTEQRWAELIGGLLELRGRAPVVPEVAPEVICLSPEAKEAWVEFFNDHAQRAGALDSQAAAAFAKIEAYALRFTLVFHAADLVLRLAQDPALVSEGCIRRALAVARWVRQETLRVYAVIAEGEDQAHLREILELAREQGGEIKPRDLQRRRSKYKGSVDLAKSRLDTLVDLGHLTRVHLPSGPRGGAPSVVYRLVDWAEDAGLCDRTLHAGGPLGFGHQRGDCLDDEEAPPANARRGLESVEKSEPHASPAAPSGPPVPVTELHCDPWGVRSVTGPAARGPIPGHFGFRGPQ